MSGERRTRLRRRGAIGLSAAVIAAAIAVTIALAAPPRAVSHGSRGPDLGTFSGYLSRGRPLTSVAASFVVPRILAAGHPGASCVWIGAQAPGAYLDAPFIQVGVNLIRDASGHDLYWGFWSDTERHFHPQSLMTVRAGDRVSAALALHGGRWRVTLRDTTSGAARVFTTRDETAARFNQAEWIQEDPARSNAQGRPHPEPYAMTEPMHMSGLRENGVAPHVPPATSQWMSLPDGDLGPSVLRGDAFTVTPRRLSSAAARYVSLARPEDAATDAFGAALIAWAHGGPAAVIVGPATQLEAALGHVAVVVSRAGWPASSAPLRTDLAAANRRLVAVTRTVSSVSRRARRGWVRRWALDAKNAGLAGQALRRALGAPGYVPTLS